MSNDIIKIFCYCIFFNDLDRNLGVISEKHENKSGCSWAFFNTGIVVVKYSKVEKII